MPRTFTDTLADILGVSQREAASVAEGIYLRADARESFAQSVVMMREADALADAIAEAEAVAFSRIGGA